LITSNIVAVQKISMIPLFSRFLIFFPLFYKTDLIAFNKLIYMQIHLIHG